MAGTNEKLAEGEKFVAAAVRSEDNKLKLNSRAALMQILMAVLANITIVSSGMGIGYPATTLPLLNEQSTDVKLSVSQASWFASITAIFSPIGGLLSGYMLDKFGRRMTLICINVISIASWLIIGFSSRSDVDLLFGQLMAARIIIGVAVGMSSSPAAVYAAEISHPQLRGRLTLLSALCTALGMLFIYLLGFLIPADYRLVSLISAGFTLFSLVVLLPIPESPTWLVGKRRLAEAQRSLAVVRGLDKSDYRIDKEVKDLVENASRSNDSASKWSELRKPELYKPLSIMIAFFAFQQFSGIFVIFVYAAQFSREAGVAIDPLLSAVYIGLTRVVTTVLMAFISDKFGRKPPAMFSGTGMCLSMMGLAACAVHPLKATAFNWVPTFLLIAFIFSCTLGFLTLPFAMIAELYPQKTRGFAAGLTICAGYFMSFLNIKAYPMLVETVGNETIFIFYGFVSLLGIAFVHFFLPETKGKSLQEIENYFRGERRAADIEMLSRS